MAGSAYSVASQLIGEQVEVRSYPERLAPFYAGGRVARIERLRSKGDTLIDCWHFIVGSKSR